MRRLAFYGHLVDALEGFDSRAGWSITFRDADGARGRPRSARSWSSKLRWRRQMSVEEFTYLRGRTKKAVKVTLRQRAAGGGVLRSREITRRVSHARRLSRGPRRFHAAGDRRAAPARVHSTSRSTRRSTRRCSTRTIREGYRQRGSDPDKMLDACIELDNAIIDGHPGVTFGIHICRGNHKSMFYASGGYDRIARAHLLARQIPSLPARIRRRAIGHVRAAALRSRRSRGRARPGQLEDAADGKSRTSCAIASPKPRAIVPLERLALSPQCGFASTHEGNRLSPDDQRRKLELVARTARSVWQTAIA